MPLGSQRLASATESLASQPRADVPRRLCSTARNRHQMTEFANCDTANIVRFFLLDESVVRYVHAK